MTTSIQVSEIIIKIAEQLHLEADVLKTAELCMALDTGRVFIGSSQEPGHKNFNGRSVTPANNIEVLTEAALDTFARLYDRMHRETNTGFCGELVRKSHLEAYLEPFEEWRDVAIYPLDQNGDLDTTTPATVYLTMADHAVVKVPYTLFDNERAVKTGVLDVIVNSNSEALVTDEYHIELDAGSYTAVDAAHPVQFRVIRDSVGYVLQCLNSSGYYRMFLQASALTNTSFDPDTPQ